MATIGGLKFVAAVADLQRAAGDMAKYLKFLALLSDKQKAKVKAAVVKAQAALDKVLDALS